MSQIEDTQISLRLSNLGYDVTVDSNFDSMELFVELKSENSSSRLAAEYYGAGYEVITSPQERYLCIYQYSGFGESGYELFEMVPELRQLEGLPCSDGVGKPPEFSPNERFLAVACVVHPELDEEPDEEPEEGDDDAIKSIHWADVYLQELPSGGITKCSVHVIPSSLMLARLTSALLANDDEPLYPNIDIYSDTEIRLPMPDGEVLSIAIPLPESVEYAPEID